MKESPSKKTSVSLTKFKIFTSYCRLRSPQKKASGKKSKNTANRRRSSPKFCKFFQTFNPFYRNIINDEENQHMFNQDDNQIEKQYEEIQKEWEVKRERYDKIKRIKENYADIDYFANMAQF